MDKSSAAAAVFNKLADLYQAKYMDVGMYSASLDLFCQTVPAKATVLELACGPGNITRYLLDNRPDLNIHGTDLAPNMVALAKTNNPTAIFEVRDCRNIRTLPDKYDGVMCGFCLPYLSKQEAIQLIADVSEITHPGALFYISTMEDDYSKSGIEYSSTGDSMFMHYHEAGYLSEALQNNRFSIVEQQRLTYKHNNKTTTDLILIASKQR